MGEGRGVGGWIGEDEEVVGVVLYQTSLSLGET